MNNRPLRLVLLVMCLAFLTKDFQDAVAIAPAPIFKIQAPSIPIFQVRQEPVIVNTPPQETPLKRRRAETQAKLGDLVGEGQRLLDGCFSRKAISDEFAKDVVSWLDRTRAVVGGNLDPSYLMELEQSPANERGTTQGFCGELDRSVGGLRTILWKEFSKDSRPKP